MSALERSQPDRWRPPLRGTAESTRQGYYSQPVLLSGPWHWLVAWYFFLGGISGTSALLAMLARLVGGERAKGVARAGSLVSLASIAPAPALLILDLGRRARFHHMLRVFKPVSPMNTGAWALTGHGIATGLGAWYELANTKVLPAPLSAIGGRLPQRAIDLGALPVSLYFSGYTGTLLAATAIPVWSRTPLLGPLFMASAAATGTAAVDGVLALAGEPGPGLLAARLAAVTAEGLLDIALETKLGATASRPLGEGRAARWYRAHQVLGIVVPLALAALPMRRSRQMRLAAASSSLAGGFCLRAAIMEAGHQSAADPGAVLETGGPAPGQPSDTRSPEE